MDEFDNMNNNNQLDLNEVGGPGHLWGGEEVVNNNNEEGVMDVEGLAGDGRGIQHGRVVDDCDNINNNTQAALDEVRGPRHSRGEKETANINNNLHNLNGTEGSGQPVRRAGL